MSATNVDCDSCGFENRVPEHGPLQVARCGNCNTVLAPGFYRQILHWTWPSRWSLVLAGGATIITFIALSTPTPPPRASPPIADAGPGFDPAPAPAPTEIPAETTSAPAPASVPEPDQGVYRVYSSAPRRAPLRIRTPSGSESYFVKLVDAYTDELVMTMFIRGGQTFETEVPLGSMQMRYASGTLWQGEDALFGPETRYNKAEQLLNFAEEPNGISGYTIELIRQVGGNLRTTSIDRTQF